jgi:hypothetical protein
MKKTKRFLPATLIALTMAAVLTTLLLAACEQAGSPSAAEQPATKPPESFPETGAKEGSITVTLAAAGNPSSGQSQSVAAAQSFASQSVARTVVPVIGTAFDAFVLTFTSESGDNDTKRETENGETTVTVKLPPDTYSLKVTGKKGDVEIAVGEIASVGIVINQTAEEKVSLRPMTKEDNDTLTAGVFSYNVTLLDTATKATLTLNKPKPDGEKVKDVDLMKGTSGTVDLLPGEYWLAVSLENEDETDKDSGDILAFGEVVYIYSTLESPFVKNFTDDTFVPTKGPLDLIMRFGPETIANGDTGELTFKEGDDSTFTLTVPDTFDTIVWYLDGTDTGETGNTYSPPNTLKRGTHFITATAKANGQTYSQLVDFYVKKKD